ncbi:MAG: sugar kinase [Pseudomonadota bacterium]
MERSPSPEILCLGEAMLEFVRTGPPGSATWLCGVGGDTSNAAVAAARQGARVGYLTALGADRFADRLVEFWNAEGVDSRYVARMADAPTGVYFIDPDPEGRFFTYYRDGSAASRMAPASLPRDAIAAAQILHLSGITLAVSEDLRATAFEAMHVARSSGTYVSVDTNLRLKLWSAQSARITIERAMAFADLCVTSVDDSKELLGINDPAQIARHYHDLGPALVLVTLGAEGCHLSRDGLASHIAPAAADPIDSTGAGDSFAGSFLAWWLELDDPVEAARHAAIVAAGTVSGLGATAPIPRRDDVLAIVAKSR